MTPRNGPGNTIESNEYPIAVSPVIMNTIPLRPSKVSVSNDLVLNEIVNVAAARAIPAKLRTGAGPTLNYTATFPIAFTIQTTRVAEAKAIATILFTFVIVQIFPFWLA